MPPPSDLDLLTLKSVWESHVTWGTPVQSFVFLGLLVFELEPMYATDRRTDGRTKATLNAPYPTGGGIIILNKLLTLLTPSLTLRSHFLKLIHGCTDA